MPWRERLYLACFYPLDSFRIKIYQLILFLFCVFVVTGGFAFHAANASELTTSEKGQITAEPLTFSLETQLLNNPILRQSAARSCRAIHVASNTTEEQNVPPYYETLIEIGDKGFPNSNVVPDIVPGMQVTVDIIGGKRTVLDYILSPIQKAASVAFREK